MAIKTETRLTRLENRNSDIVFVITSSVLVNSLIIFNTGREGRWSFLNKLSVRFSFQKRRQVNKEVKISGVRWRTWQAMQVCFMLELFLTRSLVINSKRRVDLIVKALVSGSSGLGFSPGTLCCVLWQSTLLSRCFSPPKYRNGYRLRWCRG